MNMNIAKFHLPGLFEFRELYNVFLPLYRSHRDWFYDFCEISSIYGAPLECSWGGGRVGFGESGIEREVYELTKEYGISARLTFSNSMLRPDHLSDKKCNDLCRLFEKRDDDIKNGIVICSDTLMDYIKEHYPGFYFVSSTTKVITDDAEFVAELNRNDFDYVVPDFRLNHNMSLLDSLTQAQKDKTEFLVNECCDFGCTERKACYENVSRKSLGENCPEHICHAPWASEGYVFSRAMENPAFIGTEDIKNIYLPAGFSNFKLEGRSLGSALVFEMLLYYLVKPEHILKVREAVYLDNALDLF